ncbi:endonuclease NucS domain-containing protein [Microbulbifer sp. JMSA003]|uniref:endonuclease NucS domain-containing protein n=1 Tax=Microbulbifer sp. JMSA003 TaxID=3243369 RepID=UPI00403A1E6C
MTPKRSFYRIMAGARCAFADECHREGYIGGDLSIQEDLSGRLPESVRDFNRDFIPIYLSANPDKKKVAAGLACGMLHTICKGMQIGDIVICPSGSGLYYVGEVSSDYYFAPGTALRHRRKINWFDKGVSREELSEPIRNSAGSIGTVCNLTKYADELESLLAGKQPPALVHTDSTVEEPTVFALEKHLEEFLIANWQYTELGKDYEIFNEEDLSGQQYPTDTGPIDILAISKDQKTLLVVELKRGRASDVVVGQVQRYMGYVQEELAESGQTVRGVIIALEDDLRIRRALSVTSNIDFYRYQVSFKLFSS